MRGLKSSLALGSSLAGTSPIGKGGAGVPQTSDILLTGDSQVVGMIAALRAAFGDGRNIESVARGGYTTTQAAAAIGAQPIQITVAGNQLPAFSETLLYNWDFRGSQDNGFTAVGGTAVVTPTAAGLLVENIGNDTGARRLSGVSLPIGRFKTVVSCALSETAAGLRVQSRTGANGNAGDIGSTGKGTRWSVEGNTSAAGSRVNIVGSANETGTGRLLIEHIQIWSIDADPSVAVSDKSINLLRDNNNNIGYYDARIAGVQCYVTTDGTGNHTLRRVDAGATVAIPAGTTITPLAAARAKTVLGAYGAGRNGAGPGEGGSGSGYTMDGDRSAYVAQLGHRGYLILGETTATADNAGVVSAINSRNAANKVLYGSRFVDFMPDLLAAAISDPGNPGYVNDQADVSAGRVPRSLLSDGLHFNDSGKAMKAATYKAAHTACGFL